MLFQSQEWIERTMCRINPFYADSHLEIEKAIKYGAGSIIVPYFKDITSLNKILALIDGRVKTIALVETIQSFYVLKKYLMLKIWKEFILVLMTYLLKLDSKICSRWLGCVGWRLFQRK